MDAWEEKAKATGRENKSILSGLTAFHCESLKNKGSVEGRGKVWKEGDWEEQREGSWSECII